MSLALHEALSHDVYRKKRDLARLMGCTERDVEQAVELARKSGDLPVMSGPDGYRLARNPDEYELNVARRRKRALIQLLTVKGERQLLSQWRERLNPTPPPPPPTAEPTQESLGW